MSRDDLTVLSIEELVDRFLSIALQQYEALRLYENGKYNRLYSQMENVSGELKRRSGGRRDALIPLLDHSNVNVRIKAATALLAIVPELAKQVLVEASTAVELRHAVDARGILEAVESGRYIPN